MWFTSSGKLSSSSTSTGPDSTSTVTLTSAETGLATVEASTGDSLLQSSVLNFCEGEWKLSLESERNQALASGFDSVEYTLTARNGLGSPVSGVHVIWYTNLGELTDRMVTIDTKRQARIKLKSTQTGTARVQAILYRLKM
ncbi:TPA: hypothetical protein I3789_004689 [Enterobacter cloacae]|uniref:Ig-like domain-containing protein n=1 Tax=Enterobacter cloacae TaxID=550 RepID=UPI001595B1AA|nr:hypothetical protein [Enterobacter cloacae]HAS1098105.1 hypothetical protein [Enterobacter cloacae]